MNQTPDQTLVSSHVNVTHTGLDSFIHTLYDNMILAVYMYIHIFIYIFQVTSKQWKQYVCV